MVGGVAVTIVTSDGSLVPDDTVVCLDASCVDLDDFSAAAAPSGSVASFADVAPGTHVLTVTVDGVSVFDESIEVVGGAVTEVTITLPVGGAATPGSTVTPVVPQPTVVTILPSTGAETNSFNPQLVWLMLLVSAGLIGLAGGMVWRRRG